MTDKELLKYCEDWFREIAERCDRLTSGNVSHNRSAIKGLALNAAEFITTEKQDDSPKIKGWVARDKDGELRLFEKIKPEKLDDANVFAGLSMCQLNGKLFPEVTWDSEPKEVEITINVV